MGEASTSSSEHEGAQTGVYTLVYTCVCVCVYMRVCIHVCVCVIVVHVRLLPCARQPLSAQTRHTHIRMISGKYELCGVLTHKGRSADSGHYTAWTKQADGK